MNDDPLSLILGAPDEPAIRSVDGTVRIGVCLGGDDRLVRGTEDDGPLVRVRSPLPGESVELQVRNESPAHAVTCRVYLPSGSLLVCSSFYPSADGSARCFVRFPMKRAAGTRVLVTDGTTEIWTQIL